MSVGRIFLAVMLVVFGIVHFVYPTFVAALLPCRFRALAFSGGLYSGVAGGETGTVHSCSDWPAGVVIRSTMCNSL